MTQKECFAPHEPSNWYHGARLLELSNLDKHREGVVEIECEGR